ncbi:hypothetical protein ACN6MY_12055 [Peribacillus sp. B-H-3]
MKVKDTNLSVAADAMSTVIVIFITISTISAIAILIVIGMSFSGIINLE